MLSNTWRTVVKERIKQKKEQKFLDLLKKLRNKKELVVHVLVVLEFLFHRDGDGDAVTNGDRAGEVQLLVNQNGARTGQLGAEHGGNQRTAPHAVRHHLAEHAAFRKVGVHECRVDVDGQDGEQLDVLGGQGAGERG